MGTNSYICKGNNKSLDLTFTDQWSIDVTEDRLVKTVFSTSDPVGDLNGTLWVKY